MDKPSHGTKNTAENDALIEKKLELVAKIKELQHESARLNLELFKRGIPGPCW